MRLSNKSFDDAECSSVNKFNIWVHCAMLTLNKMICCGIMVVLAYWGSFALQEYQYKCNLI